MEDKGKTIQLNTEDASDIKAEAQKTEVTQDTIEYTFVVPRGEVYVDPDLQPDVRQDDSDGQEPEDAGSLEDTKEYTAFYEDDEPETEGDEEQDSEEAEEPDDSEDSEDDEETSGTDEELPDYLKATKVVDRVSGDDSADEGSGEESGEEGEETEEGAETEAEEDAGKKTRYGLPVDKPENQELAVRMEERRRYSQKKKSRFRTRFYVIMTFLILLVAGFIFSLSGFFTIDSVIVKGNSHYTYEEIINMGHVEKGRNIFYHAQIEEITEYLTNNPYIKNAVVSRRLPSTLVITVTERAEKLAVKYDDDYLVMDETGILLRKTNTTPMITMLEGVVVSKIKLGEKIGTTDGKKMDRALKLIKSTSKADLYFVRIDMNVEEKVNAYVYDNLVVKTDYDTLLENIENGRLHRVLEKLFSDGIQRGTISFEEDGSASFMPIF